MNIVVIDNGSRYLRALSNLCETFGDVWSVTPSEINSIKSGLVVLSGSHVHGAIQSRSFYADELQFIKDYDGPILGVCAGMQLIASAYGAVLRHRMIPINGVREIRLSDRSLRFEMGGDPRAKVSERHGWEVPFVDEPLVSLANSDGGVEILRHSTHPIIGLQFHPELTSTDGKAIFKWAMDQLLTGLPNEG